MKSYDISNTKNRETGSKAIYNGNRTKWIPFQFITIQVINKLRQPRSRSQIR